jgi:transposase
MAKLERLSAEKLRTVLRDVEDGKAAKRLVVALAYKDGVTVATLSRRYGIPEQTIYEWLDRFESRPLEEAMFDQPRQGRPQKLDPEEWAEVEAALEQTPAEFGYEAEQWTPRLVNKHIEDRYNVSYSPDYLSNKLNFV